MISVQVVPNDELIRYKNSEKLVFKKKTKKTNGISVFD